jgi:hypothetical protein
MVFVLILDTHNRTVFNLILLDFFDIHGIVL